MNVNNVNSINFQGTFARNIHLEKAIERASDYDLYKFSKLLNRMNKKQDERYFELFEYAYIDGKYYINFLKYKPSYPKTYKVGIGPKESQNGQNTCYDGVIHAVNEFLEKIYPESKETKIPRETSIRRILDIVR